MELVSPIFVNTIAVLAMIGGVALAAWLIIAFYAVHSRKAEHELPEVELPGHIHEVAAGVPLAIILLIIFMAISMVSYVLYIWLGGITY